MVYCSGFEALKASISLVRSIKNGPRVGLGFSIRFWKDRICREVPTRASFARFSRLNTERSRLVIVSVMDCLVPLALGEI